MLAFTSVLEKITEWWSTSYPAAAATAPPSCYWTGGGAKWVKKTVNYPGVLSSFPPWSTSRVFSYQQKIWWADLSLGLLYCDPFQDSPELRCVLLPLGEEVIHFHGDISKYRCINLSHGKLRFVKVNSRARTPKVIMWTLNPDNYSWTLDYEVSFDKIWEDESFKKTGLPKKGPILAMIHPHAPEVVYFFLEKQLFGVDLHTSKVKECFAYESDTRLKKESSHSVLAWELPPSLIISSAEPMDKDRSPDTSTFDIIAQSSDTAMLDLSLHIKSTLLARIAVEHLNRKRKKKGNKFGEPEWLSLCCFHDKEADNSYPKKYFHLNFSACIDSKKLVVFTEFANTVEEKNSYDLLICKVLDNNCHGGLYGQNNLDVESTVSSRKRRRSLYCYACDKEVTHPMGGFFAGRNVNGSYSANRQSKCFGEEILGRIADEFGAQFTSLDRFPLTDSEIISDRRRLHTERANEALVLYHENNPDEHYEFTHLCLDDIYEFMEHTLLYMHMNFKARSMTTGLEKLFFAELTVLHDTDGSSLGFHPTICSIVGDDSLGGLKQELPVSDGEFPNDYDQQHCYACAGKMKHPIGTSYKGGHYAIDYYDE